jgi:hypothetical protein
MRARCADVTGRHRKYYGAAGVTICDRWQSFENFLADMGERPSLEYSLDRIDNSKDYEPGNCRWATRKVQGANRACVMPLTFNGKTQNPEDWARELGIKPQTLRRRVSRGWPVERVLTAPAKRGTPGESSATAKLTDELVRQLRKEGLHGTAARKKRAAELGIGLSTLEHALSGRTWSHL